VKEVRRMLWAAKECAGAEFGDARLTQRLVRLTSALAEHPASSIPEACGRWGETKAAYRFFDNEKVTPEKILEPHRRRTIERLAGHDIVLAVQDTTVLDYSSHKATKGLGPTGPEWTRGIFLHSCLAVSPEGEPLGLLGQRLWVRVVEGEPEETKESRRWIEMMEEAVAGIPETTTVVMVADRESDFYELFAHATANGRELVIRAKDRRVAGESKTVSEALFFEGKELGHHTIEVPRADGQREREATLAIQTATVRLSPPGGKGEGPELRALWIYEAGDPPEGQKAIEWFLLTTLPVATLEDAVRVLTFYTYRWRIERFHYVLKSGCGVERLQLETGRRLENALCTYSIVAWRLLHVTYAARLDPDQPCTTVLTEAEWKGLYVRIHRRRPPDRPPDLRTAIRWIAQLGGFLGRKSDGEPGVKVLWRGFRRLEDIAAMWEALHT
jgi:hypothetical protein